MEAPYFQGLDDARKLRTSDGCGSCRQSVWNSMDEDGPFFRAYADSNYTTPVFDAILSERSDTYTLEHLASCPLALSDDFDAFFLRSQPLECRAVKQRVAFKQYLPLGQRKFPSRAQIQILTF